MAIRSLHFVLGDQLTRDGAVLDGLDPARDLVLMAEVMEEATYVRHHKQKIAFLFSAMRHFAAALKAEGVRVDYVRLDDAANTGSFTGELERAAKRHRPERVVAIEPGEWRVREMMLAWSDRLGLPVEIREDDRFFCSRARFARWAGDRHALRMELFYREMRRETGLLMDADKPAGGRWNFDAENRKPLPADATVPERAGIRARCAHARRAGARRPAFCGPLRRPGAVRLGRDPRAGAAGLAPVHRPPPAPVRRLPGRHEDRRALPAPRRHLPLPERGPARRARGLPRGRTGVEGRQGAAERGRGLHPPDPRLARICAGDLLASYAGLCGEQRARRPARPALVLLVGRDGPELHSPGRGRNAGPRLRPPHPAADGDRELRPARRDRSRPGGGLVPDRLRRRLRLGGVAQHPRHGPVRGRGRAGLQALCGLRRLHQPDVRLLRCLPL